MITKDLAISLSQTSLPKCDASRRLKHKRLIVVVEDISPDKAPSGPKSQESLTYYFRDPCCKMFQTPNQSLEQTKSLTFSTSAVELFDSCGRLAFHPNPSHLTEQHPIPKQVTFFWLCKTPQNCKMDMQRGTNRFFLCWCRQNAS